MIKDFIKSAGPGLNMLRPQTTENRISGVTQPAIAFGLSVATYQKGDSI